VHLIQVPLVARACPSTVKLEGVGRSELGAPFTDCLVADSYTPLGHELFNVRAGSG
jgi:hypothetical protein